MTEKENFSSQQTPSIIDTEYRNCNFSQPNCIDMKGVRLFPNNDAPRTFIDCNMVNCEPPPGSNQIGCNNAIIKRNVADSESVLEIDGFAIGGTQLKDIVYGKFENGSYLYFPTPKERLHRRLE